MITVEIVTKAVPGVENGTETWQAVKRDGNWHVRKDPEIQWSKEPFADGDADRDTVIQLLRKEHSDLF